MRRRLWWVLALLLLDCAASERIPESYEDDVEYDAEYDEDDDIEMPFAPAINKLASKLQRAVDSQGVLRARRYGNVANGVLLGATGSVTLLASVFSLQLSRVVLSIYMTAAGALLAGVELGVAPVAGWTKENLNWFTSHSGKTALLFFAGGLSWAFGKAGIVPALLTCVNGLFNLKFRSILGFVSADEQPGFKEPMHSHEEPMHAHEEPMAEPMAEEPMPAAPEQDERSAQWQPPEEEQTADLS